MVVLIVGIGFIHEAVAFMLKLFEIILSLFNTKLKIFYDMLFESLRDRQQLVYFIHRFWIIWVLKGLKVQENKIVSINV